MPISELLGLDVGQKHIGVARASSVAALAEPLASIKTSEYLQELKKIIDKNNVETIVVGLPRSLQGDETAQTAWVRDWVMQAKKALLVAFYWQDEALTSREAAKIQTSNLKHHFDEHALAAAIILQNFLDTPEADRTIC